MAMSSRATAILACGEAWLWRGQSASCGRCLPAIVAIQRRARSGFVCARTLPNNSPMTILRTHHVRSIVLEKSLRGTSLKKHTHFHILTVPVEKKKAWSTSTVETFNVKPARCCKKNSRHVVFMVTNCPPTEHICRTMMMVTQMTM